MFERFCVWCFGAPKGPFTQAIFVAATRCNFCRAKIASIFKHVRNPCDTAATNRIKNRTWFTCALLKLQLERSKNCIELLRQKSPETGLKVASTLRGKNMKTQPALILLFVLPSALILHEIKTAPQSGGIQFENNSFSCSCGWKIF